MTATSIIAYLLEDEDEEGASTKSMLSDPYIGHWFKNKHSSNLCCYYFIVSVRDWCGMYRAVTVKTLPASEKAEEIYEASVERYILEKHCDLTSIPKLDFRSEAMLKYEIEMVRKKSETKK